jgi:hypothetical protein
VTNNGRVKNDELTTKGSLIKYVINDNGVITSVTKVAVAENAAIEVKNREATAKVGGEDHYVRSNTVFFFYESGDPAKYGVAVGFNNVPDATTVAADIYFDASEGPILNAIVIPDDIGVVTGDKAFAYVADATPTETLEMVNGAPTVVYTYSVFVDGKATTVKSLSDKDTDNAAIATGIYEVVETNGFYDLTLEDLAKDDVKATIVESTYFVAGELYNIGADTEIYQATRLEVAPSFFVTINLEEADLKIVQGKDLMVDVVADANNNAEYVIFWYVDTP